MRDSILFVLFDLPVKDKGQRREYTKFRKNLKKSGYYFIQKSIYMKHLHNAGNVHSEIHELKSAAPKKGNILSLSISTDQFMNIEVIRGSKLDFNLLCDNIIDC